MTTLKELTAEKHTEAENTPFMKAVFAGTLPTNYYSDFLFQKMEIYRKIEMIAYTKGFLDDLHPIRRGAALLSDYMSRTGGPPPNFQLFHVRKPTGNYAGYLTGDMLANPNPNLILAHLYVWHMGDMYGGQMIKNIIPGQHKSLEFPDPEKYKEILRNKLDISLADEANKAFDFAIGILNSYEF